NVQCNNGKTSVQLEQKRYLPLGSKGNADSIWHVPVSVKYATKGKTQEKYFLLDQTKAAFDLTSGACPDWVMPNADGAGYYKWGMSQTNLNQLRNSGMRDLTVREELSLADSAMAAFANGTLPAADALR